MSWVLMQVFEVQEELSLQFEFCGLLGIPMSSKQYLQLASQVLIKHLHEVAPCIEVLIVCLSSIKMKAPIFGGVIF